MRQIIVTIVVSLLLLQLTSCAAIQRETRLIQGDWPKDEYFVGREVHISKLPRVNLWSSCPDETMAFIGPLIGVPLPVIPNPFWPFRYWSSRNRSASFQLTITSPPKTINWENVNIEMLLNGKTITAKPFQDYTDVWKDEHRYYYVFGITCGELEESKIDVNITGLPEKIETRLLYTHRWRIYAEGI
jgi:hypothetical protein